MTSVHSSRAIKIAVALVWLALFVAAYVWLQHAGIPFRHLPRFIRELVRGFGFWGPLILLALFFARSIFFFIPTTVLTFVAGSLYGPIWGTLINILGDNLSSSFEFAMGRFFGRRFVKEHEHAWVKKYDQLLREDGFFAVLVMRLLFFPFDLVNYGCGMTGMLYPQYALGTFLGTIPAIVTFTVLGGSFDRPEGFLIFMVLLVLTIGSIFLIRRSAWVKRRLFPKHPPVEHVI